MIDNLTEAGQRRDQFQLALESELVRAKQYLEDRQGLDNGTSGRIANLIETLYARLLRSKVFPDSSYRVMVERLAHCAVSNLPVEIFCGLAGETASHEIDALLNLKQVFSANGLKIDLHALLVFWPYLEDANELIGLETLLGDSTLQQQALQGQIAEAVAKWRTTGLPAESLETWQLKLGKREKRSPYPYPDVFIDPPPEIVQAGRETNIFSPQADKRVQEQEIKILEYYRGRESLAKHGPFQPSFDLIIRRAIGKRFKAQAENFPNQALMATTELSGSLLRYYDTDESLPILNLKT